MLISLQLPEANLPFTNNWQLNIFQTCTKTFVCDYDWVENYPEEHKTEKEKGNVKNCAIDLFKTKHTD